MIHGNIFRKLRNFANYKIVLQMDSAFAPRCLAYLQLCFTCISESTTSHMSECVWCVIPKARWPVGLVGPVKTRRLLGVVVRDTEGGQMCAVGVQCVQVYLSLFYHHTSLSQSVTLLAHSKKWGHICFWPTHGVWRFPGQRSNSRQQPPELQ